MAKYLCLTQANYVYFDSDIRVLEDFRTDKELYSEAELQSVFREIQRNLPGVLSP
jgi:hypothetical protein